MTPGTETTTQSAKVNSRHKLLVAAEEMILRSGLSTMRTRNLASAAGVNISLIAYHFGGVDNLVAEVASSNVDAILRRQRDLVDVLPGNASPEQILRALFEPLMVPATFTSGARAAFVVQEILSHVEPGNPMQAELELGAEFEPLIERLVQACPHLARERVLWRFYCLFGGGVSMSPRAPSWRLFQSMSAATIDDLSELVATAVAALSHPG